MLVAIGQYRILVSDVRSLRRRANIRDAVVAVTIVFGPDGEPHDFAVRKLLADINTPVVANRGLQAWRRFVEAAFDNLGDLYNQSNWKHAVLDQLALLCCGDTCVSGEAWLVGSWKLTNGRQLTNRTDLASTPLTFGFRMARQTAVAATAEGR